MQGGEPKNKRPTKVVNVKETHVVSKSNQLVEARYKLSLREQRFILIMASMIEPKDKELQFYRVPSGDLIRALGWEKEHDAYKRLRKLIRGLQKRLLQIKRPNGKVLETQWVGSAEYEPGFVEFEFSAKLKPYLLQLREQFTRYKLKNIIQLQSIYSIRLYELLKQYETIGIRRITLEELREYLELKSKAYASYGNIKSRVLRPAQSEIEKNTDILFTFDEIKHSRKVVELLFTIKPNKSKQSLLYASDGESEATMVKGMRRAGVSKHEANKIWEKQWGFLDKEAREAVEPLIAGGLQFDQYVRDKLFLLESAQKQKKVPSTGGYLRDAIKHNWTSGDQESRQKKAQRKAHFQQRVQEEEVRRDREDAEARNKRARDAQMDAQYITLSPAQQERINTLVVERLLTMDDFTAQRIEIRRVADEVNSGEHLFRKLPAGVRVSAQRIRREIVATIE